VCAGTGTAVSIARTTLLSDSKVGQHSIAASSLQMLQQYLLPPKFETTTSASSKSMSVHTEACDSTSADASRSTRMAGRPVSVVGVSVANSIEAATFGGVGVLTRRTGHR